MYLILSGKRLCHFLGSLASPGFAGGCSRLSGIKLRLILRGVVIIMLLTASETPLFMIYAFVTGVG